MNFFINLFLGIIIVIINFLPFVITENIDKAIQGFLWLSQNSTYQSLIGFLSHQAETIFTLLNKTIFFFFSIYLGFIIFFLLNLNKKNFLFNIDIILFLIIAPISIEILFLLKHFWFHHFSLFSIFISFSIGYFLFISSNLLNYITVPVKKVFIFFIILLFFNDLSLIFTNYKKSLKNNYNQIILKEVKKFNHDEIFKFNKEKIEFLYPYNIYIHWMFEESRYGFPHPAMTANILTRGYENLKFTSPIDIPSNKEEFCKKIENDGPEFIILDNIYYEYTLPIEECFANNNSRYILYKNIKLKNNVKILIFKKYA